MQRKRPEAAHTSGGTNSVPSFWGSHEKENTSNMFDYSGRLNGLRAQSEDPI